MDKPDPIAGFLGAATAELRAHLRTGADIDLVDLDQLYA